MGALGLAALVPLARAERRRAVTAVAGAPPIRRLAAVIPVFRSERVGGRDGRTLAHVDHLVLVDDGAPPDVAALIDARRARPARARRAPRRNHGKGTAVAAGIDAALGARPDAVVVLDSDGQHPPELIPAFVAAASADVVIGDRPRSGAMPRRPSRRERALELGAQPRRRAGACATARTACACSAPTRCAPCRPPAGRYEAETRHLKALLRGGRDVAWVPMPAIYGGEPSSFRAVADRLLVARACSPPRRSRRPARPGSRCATLAARVGAADRARHAARLGGRRAVPAARAADERLFLAINGLGDGPEWLYQALDPHSRNYLLLAAARHARRARRARAAPATRAARCSRWRFAGVFADLVLEVDPARRRPAAAGGGARRRRRAQPRPPLEPHPVVPVRPPDRDGRARVAAAAMAPRLRFPLLVYLAAIAVTRITFGAHFPLDVAVGAIIGWQVGLFVACARRLLPPRGALRSAGGRGRPSRPLTPARDGEHGAPIAMPSAAPASTSSQKCTPR